jgi:hypothetical protein
LNYAREARFPLPLISRDRAIRQAVREYPDPGPPLNPTPRFQVRAFMTVL